MVTYKHRGVVQHIEIRCVEHSLPIAGQGRGDPCPLLRKPDGDVNRMVLVAVGIHKHPVWSNECDVTLHTALGYGPGICIYPVADLHRVGRLHNPDILSTFSPRKRLA